MCKGTQQESEHRIVLIVGRPDLLELNTHTRHLVSAIGGGLQASVKVTARTLV